MPTCKGTATAGATHSSATAAVISSTAKVGPTSWSVARATTSISSTTLLTRCLRTLVEGIDTVFSTAHFRLSENVETLVLQGNADLQGYGDSHANTLYGNTGNNILNGEAGADMLVGGQGNDAFIFDVGQAAGDTVVDFVGNGEAAGDLLIFVGYDPSATFTNVDPTHWQVNYNGGASHEVITFMNGASIHASDIVFM